MSNNGKTSVGTIGALIHLDRYYSAKKAYYSGTPLPEYADPDIDPKSGMVKGDQSFDNFERGVRSMCRYNPVTASLAHVAGYDEDKHQEVRDLLRIAEQEMADYDNKAKVF
jgi:hypothetical protein